MNFPGEDGGRSLAEMAQRDLDAALQLLADRAQYITGAGGAAIALRRDGKNDLLCRASAGENAPELGALLSTEFGLSGESVRTRKALRCDDAERDARVNREVCRELGIASVVVMPVVHDDDVLGVFELFSGKANAFGDRDMTALERLSGMVETAVRLAQAAESVSGLAAAQLLRNKKSVAEETVTAEFVADLTAELSAAPVAGVAEKAGPAAPVPVKAEAAPAISVAAIGVTAVAPAATALEAPVASVPLADAAVSVAAPAAKVEKRVLWSATMPATDEPTAGEVDRSHVPPVLRDLKKCEACGFPVSAGRTLCVECEEKKWRGQLKPRAAAVAAQSSAAAPAPAREPASAEALSRVETAPAAATAVAKEEPQVPLQSAPVADFVLSAGLEPSQSWFGRYKYVIIAILLAGAAIAGLVLLR